MRALLQQQQQRAAEVRAAAGPAKAAGARHPRACSCSCSTSTAVLTRTSTQQQHTAPRYRKSAAFGASLQLPAGAHNGGRWRMGRWLDNRAEIEVPVPLDICWVLWEDRERIPLWMPWIKSVVVQQDAPALSRWTLATHQFGRDWEFSWLARNLAPVRGQKIHWVSEPGSASLGLNINNRGQIRFIKRPTSTNVSLSISYEVPEVLAPFANALTPVVEGIISKDMERFKEYATAYAAAQQASTPR